MLFLTLELGTTQDTTSRVDQARTVVELLNMCIDGRNHKSQPGEESSLMSFCSPWKKRSCCTQEIAERMHLDRNWLNFDWNHCGELSPSCREFFVKDLCFYECSPNLGPWIVPDRRKIRSERFVGVPLCQTECNNWWSACKNDYTCLDNWANNFNWSTGINTCPTGRTCQKFTNIFGTAERFCQGVWNDSFKVVPDGDDCFRLWFSADEPNPNDAVARKYAEQLLGTSHSAHFRSGGNLILFALFLCWFLDW
ncbi:folate receptor gamma-like isoform X3 [Pomacea canaliculata]|nr:folate receptor gamma-like isoform X3 [Pomacea canaliculata]XP_025087921.1 folate receptor gamma-like isoform X3 [Pomacea canaliculata]